LSAISQPITENDIFKPFPGSHIPPIKGNLAEEIDLLDTMLSSLVEVLEEKGLISQHQWEKRIKERVKIE